LCECSPWQEQLIGQFLVQKVKDEAYQMSKTQPNEVDQPFPIQTWQNNQHSILHQGTKSNLISDLRIAALMNKI